jgi:hypothetical protein
VNTEKWQHSPLCSGNGIAPNPGCSCGLVSWLYREAERNADEGGSAGTGAAPPDLRDRVRDDWTAGYKAGQESGVPPSPEGANERFERIAAEFYEDTGYLRPGKDVPAAVGGESYDRERNAAWKIWNAARVRGGAAQPPPDPEVIREALDCEFRRIGIHHPLEILHRVACCAADALQRVANPDLVRFGVPREETKP